MSHTFPKFDIVEADCGTIVVDCGLEQQRDALARLRLER
jgi:hypothetical protein